MMLDTLSSDMITEIEEFLRAQIKRTAHPLVSKTTDELVREALRDVPEVKQARNPCSLPSTAWKFMPDWVISTRRMVRSNTVYEIDPREHIRLTIEIINRWGWADDRLRTKSGRRCILGAQLLLARMGYGSEKTVREAGRLIQAVLHDRGVTEWYWHWNDDYGVTKDQVLSVLREAAK